MKVAIVGGGPAALEAILAFQNLGASVYLFGKLPCPTFQNTCDFFRHSNLLSKTGEYSLLKMVSQLGLEILDQKIGEIQISNLEDYYQHYYLPLTQKILKGVRVIDDPVVRIHKRFLAPREEIKGRGRLYDLFRVVVLHSPSQVDLLNSNQEIHQELLEPLERFYDFDLVVDARFDAFKSGEMGPSNASPVGQNRFNLKKLLLDNVKKLKEIEQSELPIAIIGSGVRAARWILALDSITPLKRIILITEETTPFQKVKEMWKGSSDLARLDDYFWRKQAKAKEEKIIDFEFFLGCNVMAIDNLSDQEGFFVTSESPNWRIGSEQIMTRQVSRVINCTRIIYESSIFVGLGDYSNSIVWDEPGIYTLSGNEAYPCDEIVENLSRLDKILTDVVKYFSRSI